ncbi:GtrA family protein [Paraburkholderia antibiotica]|uniref:GtrA family protein n=1 Tax=Paraburkholderia antibiotica TaxID=2728839 RepID=A0A7X9X3Q5_9BURK|nr:GtrA family protein [Paraburkholderia antibiotica]NML30843.1 GtrA family protein [Paraburkholderia antibiotica]
MTTELLSVKRKRASPQFLKFLLAGGVAAAVNFGSRIVFNHWMPFSAAIVVAYIAGMITAFVLTKLFVFTDSERPTWQSAVFFTLVNIVAVLQTWAVSVVLAYYVLPWLNVSWHPKEIAHFVGVVVPVFTSYIGHKKLTFK